MINENNDHYVYIHRRKDNNTVFYIGHGRLKRKDSSSKTKTKNWKKINSEANGHSVEVISDNLTKQEAENLEEKLILNPDKDWELVNVRKPVRSYVLDSDYLNYTFEYSEESPTYLKWRNSHFPAFKGKYAGSLQKTGQDKSYWCVRNNGKLMLIHRVIWVMFNGRDIPKGMVIDHIDGNGLNNKIDNLRLLTQQENSSMKQSKLGKSGVRGVRKEIRGSGDYWSASIYTNGIDIMKCFSIKKYGEELAFEMAVAKRKEFELEFQPK